ncbi:signal transduction histidine kinase [Hydrogenispora ethanolica]|uniref:histidine kinase n=1 Tax=Hydrogenispora ethanolica TaxID=1082276 RepID=A0A4R1S7G7_HYDET|nr:sensor histidine kinase [Hydrogenispora ethanolica]TCL75278.1 signal transduction histidine kinase [Hydrogenispora ethanolica]
MPERWWRMVVPGLAVAGHLFAWIQFQYRIDALPLPEAWRSQFVFLLLFSLAFALALSFCRRLLFTWLLLSGQALLLTVIGLPFGDYLGVEVTLLAAFIIEAIFYTPWWQGAAAAAGLTGIAVGLQQLPITAWGARLSVASAHDQLAFAVYAGLLIALALLLRLEKDAQSGTATQNRSLHDATLQLSQINMQLQEYAAMAEQESVLTERKRLAREIHDTLAYTLTNLVMMMEAAMDMAGDPGAALRDHLQLSRDQAKAGLAEVRTTLQELRAVKPSETAGLPAIKQLVDTFVKATQMEVSLNFGNAPLRFGAEADWTAYRVVQEGLTNALRHGRASRVWISFAWVGAGISILIRDNGQGAAGLKEGYGLMGMRERLERLGGRMLVESKPGDGFLLSVWFPVKEGVE